jgi:hypothetical protein
MANRVPLIVDIDDSNKIKELPIGDNLDLSGSDISQVANITATGIIRQAGIPVSTFSGNYEDINFKPVIATQTSGLVNDGNGDPGQVFITASDIPPDTDTLNDVVQRGQTSLNGIIIATATQDIAVSGNTQNNNIANFTFNNAGGLTDTPAYIAIKHTDNNLGKLAAIHYDGVDNGNNAVTYGKLNMSVSNNTQTGLESRYDFTIRGGSAVGGSEVTPVVINKDGMTVIGAVTGDINSATTSTFNALTASTVSVSTSASFGTIEIDSTNRTIQSGSNRLNLGSNNADISLGGAATNLIDIQTTGGGKVNINNTLEVDGPLKAQNFPLSATFTGGMNITGVSPNFTVASADSFATYGSTASIKLKSDRKNPPINNDMGSIDFIGLAAQDTWASYRTVAKIRVATEDDDAVLGSGQSSYFYKFEVFDNSHTPANPGDYTSIPFVIGYNSEPSGASGDAYKGTIVNYYNSKDDFIVLGGTTDSNGFPNKLFKVDYDTEVVSVHGAATVGGELTVTGTGTSTVGGNLTVTGNLQVDGTTTTLNSTELVIDDKLITVAGGSANAAAANGGGIEIDLGVDANASLTYVSSTDRWTFDRELAATNMYATTFTGALSGNATSANTLSTARNINGVAFNGSAAITITAQTPNAFLPGTGISFGAAVASWTGDAQRTITNTDLGSDQNIVKNFAVADADGSFTFGETGSFAAGDNNDTFTFIGGTSIDIDIDATNGALKINNDGVTAVSTGTGLSANSNATGAVSITNTDRGSAQNIFKTVAVTGSNSLVAETNSDTLTVTGGSGITVAGNAGTDTLTITNSGVIDLTQGTAMTISETSGNYTITNNGIHSISGTANEISVSTASNVATLSLPASIQTTNATFTGTLAVNGNATLGNATADQVTFNNATGTPGNTAAPAGYMQVTINGATAYLPYYQ